MVDAKKSKMSRRNFLRNTAVGTAAVGAFAAAPTVLGLAENVRGDATPGDPGVPLMAYVKDASTGTVVVMWGTNEVVTRDPRLVARLVSYARG